MALQKITPAHKILDALDHLKKEIKKIEDEVIATLPREKKRPSRGQRPFKNPRTGQVRYI